MAELPDPAHVVYRDYGLFGPQLLEMRRRIGKDVLPVDVADIIDEHPELVDERIRDYVVRGLRGELKKKRGVKRTTTQMLKEAYVEALYDHLYPRIEARRKRERARGKVRAGGDFAPSELAYAITARHVGMTWEGVRNLIPSLKKRQKSE